MKIAFLSTFLLLTACAGMNSQFECHVKGQGVCQPMSQVDGSWEQYR